eukprot:COSAG05_NODE_2448_length_3055_cov_3.566982_2_plen_118_part_00
MESVVVASASHDIAESDGGGSLESEGDEECPGAAHGAVAVVGATAQAAQSAHRLKKLEYVGEVAVAIYEPGRNQKCRSVTVTSVPLAVLQLAAWPSACLHGRASCGQSPYRHRRHLL